MPTDHRANARLADSTPAAAKSYVAVAVGAGFSRLNWAVGAPLAMLTELLAALPRKGSVTGGGHGFPAALHLAGAAKSDA